MNKLYLIPTTLSPTVDGHALLSQQLSQIKHLKYFIVETAKVARQHLKHLELDTLLQELQIQELNKHSQDLSQLIQPLLDGHDVGLMSDCGTPAIADPGNQIVRLAHEYNIEVVPLIGPNSLVLALMASGANGQSFTFNGYLPIVHETRIQKIKQLQNTILAQKTSQIIIETPFRNQQLLKTLISMLNANIRLSIAINLMSSNQQIISQTIQKWQTLATLPDIHKHEVVFVLG